MAAYSLCLPQVNSLYKRGDYTGAEAASRSAQHWGTLSCVVGGLLLMSAAIGGLVLRYAIHTA